MCQKTSFISQLEAHNFTSQFTSQPTQKKRFKLGKRKKSSFQHGGACPSDRHRSGTALRPRPPLRLLLGDEWPGGGCWVGCRLFFFWSGPSVPIFWGGWDFRESFLFWRIFLRKNCLEERYLWIQSGKKNTTKKMNKSPMRLAPNLNFCLAGFITMKSLKRIIEGLNDPIVTGQMWQTHSLIT